MTETTHPSAAATAASASVTLTEEQLDAYGLVENPANGGGTTFSYEEVKDRPLRTVWSLVDGDDGGIYALPGFHVVNAIGSYIVTEKEWTDDIAEGCYWPPDDDEEEEDEEAGQEEATRTQGASAT